MKNNINIEVSLDENKIPETIQWKVDGKDYATVKAILLSLWDGEDKSALKLDLWTKNMRIDELGDFFFQTFMTMADTFKKANNHSKLDEDIKNFASSFYQKFLNEIKAK